MEYTQLILDNLPSYIDHTLLKPQATPEDIIRLCEEAIDHHFFAVCIAPCFVSQATKLLINQLPKLCTVIGFPLGANAEGIKLDEARRALDEGADELDMVMNIGYFLHQDYDYVEREIASIFETCTKQGATLKVIIETALLTVDQIEQAAEIVFKAGADFVKTSTGFSQRGATLEDVMILRKIADKHDRHVKAAGGIRNLETAYRMIMEGADRIGSSSSVQIMEELVRPG